MKSFIVGVICGIILSTVGLSGFVKIVENGVEKTKSFAIENVKE